MHGWISRGHLSTYAPLQQWAPWAGFCVPTKFFASIKCEILQRGCLKCKTVLPGSFWAYATALIANADKCGHSKSICIIFMCQSLGLWASESPAIFMQRYKIRWLIDAVPCIIRTCQKGYFYMRIYSALFQKDGICAKKKSQLVATLNGGHLEFSCSRYHNSNPKVSVQ